MSSHTEFTILITPLLSSHLTSLSPSLYVRSLLLAPSSFQSVLTPTVLPSLIRQYINLSRVEMRKDHMGQGCDGVLVKTQCTSLRGHRCPLRDANERQQQSHLLT